MFQEDLKKFVERFGTPLIKAVAPDDFAAIRGETDPHGADVVDHMFDLNGHPVHHNGKVEHYRNTIAGIAPIIRSLPEKLRGVTAKVVYSLPKAGKMANPDKVLVKPYHEKLHPKAEFWQKHPIQGWAEMTNQALWHAAGMGHVHQKVHVTEHDMGPGFDKHPAVVIHMDPRAKPVSMLSTEYWNYHPTMYDDAFKVGMLDFLTNNMDRHRENLMYLPDDAVDDAGMPVQSRLLAIDHGRSFQYHASHKGAPQYELDPVMGNMTVPEEEREQMNMEGKSHDSPIYYLDSDGLRHILNMAGWDGAKPFFSPSVVVNGLTQWWPRVRTQVINALAYRLKGLKESRMQEHIYKNFMARVAKLDDIVARPDFYLKEARKPDLDVPLHIWDRE